MPKILHTGDIHLDSIFTSLPDEEARNRRKSLRYVFSNIIDTANREKVDALILAGDIFDTYPIRIETEELFLRELKRAKCRVFITPGNHDPLTPNSPYSTLPLPENVHVFESDSLKVVEIPELSLRVFGAAYKGESYDERILSGFSVPDDEFINIVILHSNLYTEGYSPVSPDEIRKCGADYIALAHVHKPTELLREGNTFFSYCGCPESRDFGECYDTAVSLCNVEKGSVTLTRIPVSDIAYRNETVNISETPDVKTALPTKRKREFLRLTLVGECESPDIDGIRNELLNSFEEVEITDRTEEPRNIWEGLSEDGLRGLFLQKMKARLDAENDENERKKIELAVKLGIDAIENRDV